MKGFCQSSHSLKLPLQGIAKYSLNAPGQGTLDTQKGVSSISRLKNIKNLKAKYLRKQRQM